MTNEKPRTMKFETILIICLGALGAISIAGCALFPIDTKWFMLLLLPSVIIFGMIYKEERKRLLN